MKGLLLYRIIRFVLNFFCLLLALQTFVAFFALIGNPVFYLPLFIIICVVLYGWFSNVFFVKVIIKQQPIKKRTKDLLLVNGIVTFIFGLILVTEVIYLFYNPTVYTDALLKMNPEFPPEYVGSMLKVLLFFAVIILSHVSWTYMLLRKNKALILPE